MVPVAPMTMIFMVSPFAVPAPSAARGGLMEVKSGTARRISQAARVAADPVGVASALDGTVTLQCREREASATQELSGLCDHVPPRGHRRAANVGSSIVGGSLFVLNVTSRTAAFDFVECSRVACAWLFNFFFFFDRQNVTCHGRLGVGNRLTCRRTQLLIDGQTALRPFKPEHAVAF